MKVLVTGGAGFIGSNFVRYWLNNHPHDEVVVLDVLTYAGNLDSLHDLTINPAFKDRFQFIKGDITDPVAVRNAMKGIDLVAHFAANSHVDRSIVEPGNFVNTNVMGTQVLLEEAKNAGVWRFHHVSTDEVYGTLTVHGNEMFTEETKYAPNNPYSASKAGSDLVARAYYKTYDMPVTITNTSNNFGPYQFPEKFIPLCITRLIDGKNIRLHGKGDHIRDWLFVEDHCRAIEQVLRRGRMGEVYLVAGHAQLSTLEVAQRICKIMGVGEDRIEFVPDRPNNDSAYKLDWKKIKDELKWEPLFSFDQWLEKTVAWYVDNEVWWRPLVKQGFSWGSVGHVAEEEKTPQPANPSIAMPMANTLKTGSQQATYGEASQVIAEASENHPITFLETNPQTIPPVKQTDKVLIFGNGQLSMHFQKYFEAKGIEVSVAARPQTDVTSFEQVKSAIETVKPTIVLNATGITNVDWAEANQEETAAVNIHGAENIAKACMEAKIYMIHVSTGYVHHSHNTADERTEVDQANPLNYYAYSKAKADEVLLQLAKQGLQVLIVRPNMLLSAVPHPKNILAKMTVYSKFHDVPNSMTVIEDLVEVTGELIKQRKTGLYNVVNPGLSSPFKIATMLKEIINPDMAIEKLTKADVEKMYSVKRPDTILSITKLNREGIQMPEINQRLRGIITVLRDNLQQEASRQVMQVTAQENQQKMEMKQDQVINNLFTKN
ncbi:MAG TPA: dTDP-glucose 4,6-dehydratase [Patescibacteria group bacterium]|jgi:dTDP-glucose 4,6-dehydratase|nr:dTDP-glucose 4,6-dehydratase [Patescibacteria group bacterium]